MKTIALILLAIAGYFTLDLAKISDKSYIDTASFVEKATINTVKIHSNDEFTRITIKNTVNVKSEAKEIMLTDEEKSKIKPIVLLMQVLTIFAIFGGLTILILKIKDR